MNPMITPDVVRAEVAYRLERDRVNARPTTRHPVRSGLLLLLWGRRRSTAVPPAAGVRRA